MEGSGVGKLPVIQVKDKTFVRALRRQRAGRNQGEV